MMKIALLPNNNHLSENGYSLEEQEEIFDAQLQDVLDNIRWYLDNLDYLQTYKVGWANYREGYQIVFPYRYSYQKKKRVFK